MKLFLKKIMSTTHFARYRGLANSVNKKLTKSYIERMIVREPALKEKNLHPRAKLMWNQMT